MEDKEGCIGGGGGARKGMKSYNYDGRCIKHASTLGKDEKNQQKQQKTTKGHYDLTVN